MMNKLSNNWLIMIGVVALALGPLLVLQGKEFGATDAKNSTVIQEIQPDYQPWFNSVIQPSGPEVQTFLFAAQASIGAGLAGYVLGFYKGRAQRKQRNESSD